MARIAVAGMQHETNTFAPTKAGLEDFAHGGGWPGLCRGADIRESVNGANIPITGAIAALTEAGHDLLPLVWGAASPSAHVTRQAFETIVGDMTARLAAAQPVDGVYLDLHGAMVTEDQDDGEGELLSRLRRVVGPRVPIVASLDLHANVTRRMVAESDALSIYRTYPHTDMAETGARAAGLLDRMVRSGIRPAKLLQSFDFLTGLPSQTTFTEPAASLYRLLAHIEARSGVALSFATGFPMADFDECGMTVVGYGSDGASTQAAVNELAAAIRDAEPHFALELLSPDAAVQRAMRIG